MGGKPVFSSRNSLPQIGREVNSKTLFSRTGELCPCGIAASSRADRSTGGSMQTVFEVLGGARGRRPGRQTGQRVHRYSRTEEAREGRFWLPLKPKNENGRASRRERVGPCV